MLLLCSRVKSRHIYGNWSDFRDLLLFDEGCITIGTAWDPDPSEVRPELGFAPSHETVGVKDVMALSLSNDVFVGEVLNANSTALL